MATVCSCFLWQAIIVPSSRYQYLPNSAVFTVSSCPGSSTSEHAFVESMQPSQFLPGPTPGISKVTNIQVHVTPCFHCSTIHQELFIARSYIILYFLLCILTKAPSIHYPTVPLYSQHVRSPRLSSDVPFLTLGLIIKRAKLHQS